MIRSTLTAHLAETDRQEFTLQINDRDIGLLAAQHQRHYVMSGNRRVQLIAGLHTRREDTSSVSATRALLRLWLMTFRDLQINGLARFPQCADTHELDADFLLLMDSGRVFVWCRRDQGVYLLRGKHLYRQQPTYPPAHNSLRLCCRHLDFYAFRPREGDDMLVIDPAFIDLFDYVDLETMLTDTHQMNIAMTELARLAAHYGHQTDTTWFSAQIQKLEPEPELLSADAREIVSGRCSGDDRARHWLSRIRWSKVVPLMDGNVLVLPPDLDARLKHLNTKTTPPAHQPKPPHFTTRLDHGNGEPSSRVNLDEPDEKTRQRRSKKSLTGAYEGKKTWLDRVKEWNTDNLRDRLSGFNRRLMTLVPASRGLSLLAYAAIWLVVLVLLVAVFLAIRGGRDSNGSQSDVKPKVSAPLNSDQVRTDFEIDVEVRASSLRVVAAPDSEELVATVQRGEHVTQLANPSNGWVLIRIADGRMGYVPESLLLSQDSSGS